MATAASRLVRTLLDALAPHHCAGCDTTGGDALCEHCVEALLVEPLPAPRASCGARVLIAFPHAGVARRAIHAGKYRQDPRAISLLAALAAERLAPALLGTPRPDAVVPVALGSRRRRARGYNQAEVAARPFCAFAGIAAPAVGLVRLRETSPQVGSGRRARCANLDNAFLWTGASLAQGAVVWLIDDVLTTGATLEAAAKALQRAGAARIEAVAVTGAPG